MALRDWFEDLPLRGKLIACLVLFVVIPLLVVAIFINVQVSRVMQKNVRETYMQVLKQSKPPIEGLARDLELISLTLLSDENMQEMIKYYTRETAQSLEQRAYNFNLSIQPLMVSRPYIWAICVSHDSNVIFQYGDRVTEENPQLVAEADLLKGRPYWTSVYKLENRSSIKKEDVYVISLVRTINDLYKMQAIGTERISIRESDLSGLYAGINQERAGKIFIINNQGTVISSPDKSELGLNLSQESFVQQIAPTSEGFFQTRINNQKVTVFHYPVAETGWVVVHWLPDTVIYRQINLTNIIILVSLLFCILFGLLFSQIQNRSVNRPIMTMVAEMDKVRHGNFDISLKTRGHDEIGVLGQHFLDMVLQIKSLIDTVYKSQIKAREAELIALESQINPHFLYNTLDSIRWLALKNHDQAVGDQILALSNLFRHSLNKGQEMTTVRNELDHLKQYVLIQDYRYGDRIRFLTEVDDQLLDIPCPKLILQPLVENAIVHGLERKVGQGHVFVRVYRTAQSLVLEVEDDGVGTDEQSIQASLKTEDKSAANFALKNINDRIRLNYGPGYGLTFTSQVGLGTTVQCVLPLGAGDGGS